jgi:hypothetical protein
MRDQPAHDVATVDVEDHVEMAMPHAA